MAKLAAGLLRPLLAQRLAPEEQGVALLAVRQLGVGAGAGQEEVARPFLHRRELRMLQRPGGEAAGEAPGTSASKTAGGAVLGRAEQVEGVLPAVGEVGLHDLVAPALDLRIAGARPRSGRRHGDGP